MLSDNEDDTMQNAATVILLSSNSSDDMEATVGVINRIHGGTEAVLNQQTFNEALDVACVRFVCDEVSHTESVGRRVLNAFLWFDPSHHVLGCYVINIGARNCKGGSI